MLPTDLDNDSVASSPRSEYDLPPRVRFMCTFGGKILPRPHDNQLTYVGGDNRMIAVHRNITFASLLSKLSKLSGASNISVKYQLPNEDLDALISVSTDEDVENMMDEYDRVALNQNPLLARLRLFLFNNTDHDDNDSRASSISSLLDSSANRERWFLDALNSGGGGSGAGIERVRSEVSSVASEVPDYLFGLDNSEETHSRESRDHKPKIRREVSAVSDPGSPVPVVSSPFGSTSSAPVIRSSTPELPPVKTKPENPVPISEPNRHIPEGYPEPVMQQMGFSGSPAWHYSPHGHHSGHAVNQLPVYYVPGSVPPANAPAQHIPMPAQYIPHYQVQAGHHMPMGYHASHPISGPVQVHGGPVRPVMVAMDAYGQPAKIAADGANQKGYYGIKNPGPIHMYHPGMVVSGADEPYRADLDSNQGRFS